MVYPFSFKYHFIKFIFLSDNNYMITFTPNAVQELKNILANDFTLENQYFRLRIDNKGCAGFTYELGMSEKRSEDQEIDNEHLIPFIMDPFTMEYCQKGIIDFICDEDQEGFSFENLDQKKFHGKFWTKNEPK